MADPIQSAKAVTVVSLPGSVNAQGTRGMLAVTIDFTDPIGVNNSIILAISGACGLSTSTVSLGPDLPFYTPIPTGSLPARTYWFAITFTDAGNQETMLGGIQSLHLNANELFEIVIPNSGTSTSPGFSSWSLYVSFTGPTGLKRVADGANLSPTLIDGAPWYREPLAGLTLTGIDPPSTPIVDTMGNAYEQAAWWSQFNPGTNNGDNAMGYYICRNAKAGMTQLKFVCAVRNASSAITQDGVLQVIATEWPGDQGSAIDAKDVKQTASGFGDISISLTDSRLANRITGWLLANGIQNAGNTASVVDFSIDFGVDLFLAMYCNANHMGNPNPPTPTLTGGAYTFIDEEIPPGAPGTDNYPMWLWYSTSLSLRCPSSSATLGVPYSSSFVADGGTPPYTFAIISGSLPPGLTLNTSTGEVSGTPTSGGTFAYTGQVADNTGATATASCTILVAVNFSLACPSSSATLGVPYSSSFVVTGGTSPFVFSISAGSLPTGLTLNTSTGAVTGTPTFPGTFSYTGRVVDHLGLVATTNCSITVRAAPPPSPILTGNHTLRFEIPQRRWFPHYYTPVVTYHYLDEPETNKPNDQQLLMLAGNTIYKAGGNTDAGTDIQSLIQLPSYDGGDERGQKLYVDAMSEVDQLGIVSAQIQFNNQAITGPLLALTPSGPRQQFLENIASLSDLSLYRNISVLYAFTGGPDGPRFYAWEPSGYVQPYVSTSIVTQFINLAFPGWKHHRRLYAGLISNADVIFTIKTQDDRVYGPITIPSTGGQFRIIPLMVPHGCKDLAFAYQLDGQGTAFALFPDAFTIETKQWVQPSYIDLAIWNT